MLDDNCKKLVEFEIISNLLESVKPKQDSDKSPKLEVAALSAIKNLSVCSSVRPKLIAGDTVSIISSLLFSIFSPTTYKSLSIMRLLATGNGTN